MKNPKKIRSKVFWRLVLVTRKVTIKKYTDYYLNPNIYLCYHENKTLTYNTNRLTMKTKHICSPIFIKNPFTARGEMRYCIKIRMKMERITQSKTRDKVRHKEKFKKVDEIQQNENSKDTQQIMQVEIQKLNFLECCIQIMILDSLFDRVKLAHKSQELSWDFSQHFLS